MSQFVQLCAFRDTVWFCFSLSLSKEKETNKFSRKSKRYPLILISHGWHNPSSGYLVDVSIPTRTEWGKVSKLQSLAWTTVGVKSLSCCSLLIPNNANSPLDGFRNAASHLIHVFSFLGEKDIVKSIFRKCIKNILIELFSDILWC